jgi:HD-GYP domain-containing protein (c-di-GMP phosphodiesterase class II)
MQLATRMGIQDEQLTNFQRGAILHDIGKMGVPDDILLKPGPLSEQEWTVMHKHPIYAQMLLSPIQYLEKALLIPYFHHERWDGSGYPLGLRGIDIPIEARIFAVVDVWDALRSDRPYRKALSDEETLTYLREQAGILFDPDVVENFLNMLDEIQSPVSLISPE